jgi:hypothetical protein
MRERSDLRFSMITKRIDRLTKCVPKDWGEGWEHVTICCTVENPDRAVVIGFQNCIFDLSETPSYLNREKRR